MRITWADEQQHTLVMRAEVEQDCAILADLVDGTNGHPGLLAGADRVYGEPQLITNGAGRWQRSRLGWQLLIGLNWDTRGVPGGSATLPPELASVHHANSKVGSTLAELLRLLATPIPQPDDIAVPAPVFRAHHDPVTRSMGRAA